MKMMSIFINYFCYEMNMPTLAKHISGVNFYIVLLDFIFLNSRH